MRCQGCGLLLGKYVLDEHEACQRVETEVQMMQFEQQGGFYAANLHEISLGVTGPLHDVYSSTGGLICAGRCRSAEW